MNKNRIIDIYIVDKNNKLVGTVGWFYYSRLTIKELIDMYKEQGLYLRFC